MTTIYKPLLQVLNALDALGCFATVKDITGGNSHSKLELVICKYASGDGKTVRVVMTRSYQQFTDFMLENGTSYTNIYRLVQQEFKNV